MGQLLKKIIACVTIENIICSRVEYYAIIVKAMPYTVMQLADDKK